MAIPEQFKPTRRDREAAMRELARAGLGTYPDGWPSIGVTCQTVGAFGGHTPAKPEGLVSLGRDSFAGIAAPGADSQDVAPGPSVVSYSERPQGCRSERPLDSLVRRVALSRARRLARR
ncbi:MAG TPA: hypothetical protein VFY54_13290, partial [Rubrobacter sp.]|nr:hypothetical protein [Rubrobacter sp.]